jgi:hypothetical protein
MLVFGHLGFGHLLASPWRRNLPQWPLAVGMLLPDIIDKPLYYARFSDFISCTRTIGHTGLLCLVVLALGFVLGRRALTAVALGMATHLALDRTADWWSTSPEPSSAWVAITWPLHGSHFTDSYVPSVADHLRSLLAVQSIVPEILGIALLVWAERTRRTQRGAPVQKDAACPSA